MRFYILLMVVTVALSALAALVPYTLYLATGSLNPIFVFAQGMGFSLSGKEPMLRVVYVLEPPQLTVFKLVCRIVLSSEVPIKGKLLAIWNDVARLSLDTALIGAEAQHMLRTLERYCVSEVDVHGIKAELVCGSIVETSSYSCLHSEL